MKNSLKQTPSGLRFDLYPRAMGYDVTGKFGYGSGESRKGRVERERERERESGSFPDRRRGEQVAKGKGTGF